MEPKYYLYGVTVKGIKNYDKEQIALQEFESLSTLGATEILEMVRPEVAKRPKLEQLIKDLNEEDYIFMYSIDTLFKGKNNKGLEYYKQILAKGINLVIFDFSGKVCKLSPFSNTNLKVEHFYKKKDLSIEDQVNSLSQYINSREEGMKLGSFKKKGDKISDEFMCIYFAYEGYEINSEKALDLAKEYSDIQNKRTFWKAAEEFEKSYDYTFRFRLHMDFDKDFVRFPKRCGGIPEEYFQIKEIIAKYSEDLLFEQKIIMAAEELNMMVLPEMYIRWDLAYNKEPKPRNAVARSFRTAQLDDMREDRLYSTKQ